MKTKVSFTLPFKSNVIDFLCEQEKILKYGKKCHRCGKIKSRFKMKRTEIVVLDKEPLVLWICKAHRER